MQLTDRELIAALTSIILPLIISLVQRPTWSSRTRALVGFGGIFLWTVAGTVFVGDGVPQSVDWRSWVRLLLVNALVAYGSFQFLWRQLGVTQSIEAATSPPSPARDALAAEAERKATPPRDASAP